jgi:hypothetical protein
MIDSAGDCSWRTSQEQKIRRLIDSAEAVSADSPVAAETAPSESAPAAVPQLPETSYQLQRNASRCAELPAATAAPAPHPRPLLIHPQTVPAKIVAIQPAYRGAGFMPLHFDEPKAAALTGKEVAHQLDRSHTAIGSKQLGKLGVRDVRRQVPDVNSKHEQILLLLANHEPSREPLPFSVITRRKAMTSNHPMKPHRAAINRRTGCQPRCARRHLAA